MWHASYFEVMPVAAVPAFLSRRKMCLKNSRRVDKDPAIDDNQIMIINIKYRINCSLGCLGFTECE